MDREQKDELARRLGIPPEEQAVLESADRHPHGCRCDLCREWWRLMGPDPARTPGGTGRSPPKKSKKPASLERPGFQPARRNPDSFPDSLLHSPGICRIYLCRTTRRGEGETGNANRET